MGIELIMVGSKLNKTGFLENNLTRLFCGRVFCWSFGRFGRLTASRLRGNSFDSALVALGELREGKERG